MSGPRGRRPSPSPSRTARSARCRSSTPASRRCSSRSAACRCPSPLWLQPSGCNRSLPPVNRQPPWLRSPHQPLKPAPSAQAEVRRKAEMRLRYEGKENADEITDTASLFFGKPAEFVRQQLASPLRAFPCCWAAVASASPPLVSLAAARPASCGLCVCAGKSRASAARATGNAPLQLLHLLSLRRALLWRRARLRRRGRRAGRVTR